MCFEDEAGQNLRPPKARTWAPAATPVVRVSGKGSGKVSVAGLVCYKPGARARLFYKVRTHRGRKGERRSMSEADYAHLVTAAHNQLRAPMVLVWDNLNARHEVPPCLPGGDGRAPPLACRSRLVKLRAAGSWRHRTRWEQP